MSGLFLKGAWARLWTRVAEARSVLRLGAFDVETAEGRSRERYRRMALTTGAMAGSRVVAIATALITVPLTLGYLGPERYGMWMTMSSLIAMLGFADLGMNNGLLNAVSESHGKDDRAAAQAYVSSAFFLLAGVAATLGVAFTVANRFIAWKRVFNVSSPQAILEAAPAMVVLICCFLVNIPLGVVDRVQLGYQEGFMSNIWQAGGSVLSLAGVLTAIHLRAGLPWLVLAMAGGLPLASLANGVTEFGIRRPWLRPRWKSVSVKAGRTILRLGILFLILQIAAGLAYSSDNIVAAQVLGPEAVTQYAIPLRLFSFVSLIVGMLLNPLWPAYGEAVARRDMAWVRRALMRSFVGILALAGSASLFMVLFGRPILRLWVGPQISVPLLLLVGFAVWTVLGALGNAVGVFLNGAGFIGVQVICAVLMSASALFAKIWLAHLVGTPGIIWGTVLAYAVFTVLPLSIYVPRLVTRLGDASWGSPR